ncbi:MAG: hypothetical protein PUE13_07565 [Clostridiales bacterium]|nr:hypothetical protein [Clostridiales bacterium]
MIGVVTVFGETDLQHALKRAFVKSDITFMEKNMTTAVQLMSLLEHDPTGIDVVIMYEKAVSMDKLSDTVAFIRSIEPKMRIILILNGRKNEYLSGTMNMLRELAVDVIFDDNGFDTEDLIALVKQGKLQPKRKNSGFSEEQQEAARESYSKPQGHYTIAVFNADSGAGATTAAISLAKYFAVHDYSVCLADCSGSDSLRLAKVKNVDICSDAPSLELLKEKYSLTVADFGTPYEISSDGKRFRISAGSSAEYIRQIPGCDIKLIFGFCDSWNIEKLAFFAEDSEWQKLLDLSYIFLTASNSKRFKARYPHLNVFDRNDDFSELILETFRRCD